MKKPIDVPLLFQLWHSDESSRTIALKLGVSQSTLCELRKKHGLPQRKRQVNLEPDVDPTPAQIRARCAEIQSLWSQHERQVRQCGGGTRGWTVPSYTAYDRKTSTFSY